MHTGCGCVSVVKCVPEVHQAPGLIPSAPENQAWLHTRKAQHWRCRQKDQKFKVGLSYLVSFRPAWCRENKNVCIHTNLLSLQRVKSRSGKAAAAAWGPARSGPRERESSEDNTRPTSLLTVHSVYKMVMTKARSEEQCCVQKGFSKRIRECVGVRFVVSLSLWKFFFLCSLYLVM